MEEIKEKKNLTDTFYFTGSETVHLSRFSNSMTSKDCKKCKLGFKKGETKEDLVFDQIPKTKTIKHLLYAFKFTKLLLQLQKI